MSKLIVVTGITGKQGGSVADAFLASPQQWRVRGIVRDPSSAAAQAWAARPGVELARADLDDPESLVAAFAGAHAIFAMTSFLAPVLDPASWAHAAAAGVPILDYAKEVEVRRGKNLARAAASSGVIEGLERFVWSSLSAVKERSKGKYTEVRHFDGKAEVERFVRADPEMLARGLSQKASFVQLGAYADNWRVYPHELTREPDTGRIVHKALGDGMTKFPFLWTRKDTGIFVRKLVEDLEPGKSVLAYSELISCREFMARFEKILGVNLGGDEGIEELSYQEFKDMLAFDEEMKEGVTQSFAYFNEFGYDGGDPEILYPKDIGIENLLTPLDDYIKQEDWSFILGKA